MLAPSINSVPRVDEDEGGLPLSAPFLCVLMVALVFCFSFRHIFQRERAFRETAYRTPVDGDTESEGPLECCSVDAWKLIGWAVARSHAVRCVMFVVRSLDSEAWKQA